MRTRLVWPLPAAVIRHAVMPAFRSNEMVVTLRMGCPALSYGTEYIRHSLQGSATHV